MNRSHVFQLYKILSRLFVSSDGDGRGVLAHGENRTRPGDDHVRGVGHDRGADHGRGENHAHHGDDHAHGENRGRRGADHVHDENHGRRGGNHIRIEHHAHHDKNLGYPCLHIQTQHDLNKDDNYTWNYFTEVQIESFHMN